MQDAWPPLAHDERNRCSSRQDLRSLRVKSGIAPVDRLVSAVMSQDLYKSARRVFWIMDSARRMILALITSQYGEVYFLAIDSSVYRSSLERLMPNGLFLASEVRFLMQAYQITSPNRLQ
jgi:hypothetical protein